MFHPGRLDAPWSWVVRTFSGAKKRYHSKVSLGPYPLPWFPKLNPHHHHSMRHRKSYDSAHTFV